MTAMVVTETVSERRVTACPECDTTDIAPASRDRGRGRPTDRAEPWRCEQCGAFFDEPVERPTRCEEHFGAGNHGLARLLADAKPDDLRPNHDADPDDLRSDGGIVPDGFDLDDARHARSSTPPDELKRCPECLSTKWSPKAERDDPAGRDRDNDERYYCAACTTHVDGLLCPDDDDYRIPDDGIRLAGDGGGGE